MHARARHPALQVFAASTLVLGAACLEYSPHALPMDESERDLHRKAVLRLEATPPPAVLKFAVIGDTQLRFDEARAAVAAANRIDGLGFVVQLGDLTHVGLLQEYRAMREVLDELSVPYFVLIGNHDQLGNGRAIYERMFGPVDTAFTFGGTRFLLLDTNSREVGFDGSVPDLAWLRSRLVGAVAQECTALANAAVGRYGEAPVVLFAHVASDVEEFDVALRPEYAELLRGGGVRASFHGHEHRFRSGADDGVPYYVVGGVEDRALLVASQRPDGGFDLERVDF
jgi:3',5'-cyclic AMP phosphodiesterase CpdA